MSEQEVRATANPFIFDEEGKKVDEKAPITLAVTYDFGDSLEEAVDKFGESVVFNKFVQQCRIDLQGNMRRGINNGKTQEELQAAALEWIPGERKPKKTAAEKIRELLKDVPESEIPDLMAELEAMEDDEDEDEVAE